MLNLKIVVSLFIAIVTSLCIVNPSVGTRSVEYNNYPQLVELLGPYSNPAEFIAFTDFEKKYEKTVHKASLEYFNTHPDLVQRIRDDLGSRKVQWRLQEVSHRIVYAPEIREEVVGLFTHYCREVIDDLLTRTGLPDPYCSISTVVDKNVNISNESGIKAFIVRDLARDYVARYQFRGTDQKRIEIDLSGRIAINEVGSYSSYLQYSEATENWEFVRNRHTFWKSASVNPYTALMSPLEETIHIALREHTEKAIIDTLAGNNRIQTLKEVQSIVDHWLAVEEAIVGGLVYKLIPDVVIKRIPDLPREWIHADLETKAAFDKYHLLPKGIEVVESHGLKESIHLYMRDPFAFRTLLSVPANAF